MIAVFLPQSRRASFFPNGATRRIASVPTFASPPRAHGARARAGRGGSGLFCVCVRVCVFVRGARLDVRLESEIRERREHEVALVEPGVRNHQTVVLGAGVVEQDVEIDRPWAEPPTAVGAAESSLRSFQDVQELHGTRADALVLDAHDHRGVQKRGLVRDVRGRGLVQARVRPRDDAARAERPQSLSEQTHAVALVAARR